MANKSKARTIVDSKFEIVEQRKLHDIWALILYVICFSILIFLTYSFAKTNRENNKTIFKLPSKYFSEKEQTMLGANQKIYVSTKEMSEFYIGDIIKLTIAPLFIFIVLLMLAYIFTTVFFHTVFIIGIILPILAAGRAIVYNRPALTIFPYIIIALLSAIFYAFIFRRIKFAAKPFKMSIRIMWSCISFFSTLILIYTFVSVGIAYVFSTSLTQGFSVRDLTIIGVFCLLVATWTMFLISMVSQVAMSAITAQYLIHDLIGAQLIGSSLKIVFYSLGSACFAALILAIVSLIRQIVEGEMDRQNREGGNFAMAMLMLVLHTLLSLIEDFLRFLTSWAMTVIALKGCKLTTAMKSVLFDIRTGFLSTLIAGRLSGMLVFFAILSVYFVLSYGTRVLYLKEVLPNSQLDKYLKPLMSETSSNYTRIGSKNYIGAFNSFPLYYFIIICVCLAGFGMLIQKIMEMIYLIFSENPNIIKRKDFAVYESMEAELNFKGGYCGC